MNSAKHDAQPQTAAGWFARVQAGSLSDAERRDFERWRAADQENALAYAQCELAWELTGALTNEAEFTHGGAPAADTASHGMALRDWRIWGSVAASVTLATTLVLTADVNSGQRYQTDIGEQRVVHLEDGSSVMLNTNSILAVSYSRSQRSLVLERGEAFFSVAKNPDRPFVVDVGGTEVRALGTAFNIEKQHDNVEVAVTQGLVEVSAQRRFWQDANRTRLQPGQGVIWHASVSTERLTPTPMDLERVTAWQARKLYFDNDRLADALAEYNRYTKRQFVLVEDTLADQRISGVFNVGDDKALTFALEKSLGARIVATDNRVLVLAEQ